MPESLATCSGLTPISYIASMMRSDIALCPQPAQRVVFPPLYSMTVRPMRLCFCGDYAVGVLAMTTFPPMLRSHR